VNICFGLFLSLKVNSLINDVLCYVFAIEKRQHQKEILKKKVIFLDLLKFGKKLILD
jgi:hypothetical protein